MSVVRETNSDQNDQAYDEKKTKSNNSGRQRTVSARRKKSATAFRTISEVAEELDVQQHVLRFWETKFSQVKPLKRGGGRRYYRPEDVALLKKIHNLLYTDGYTIKGVQKLFKGKGVQQITSAADVASQNVDEETSSAANTSEKSDTPAFQPISSMSLATVAPDGDVETKDDGVKEKIVEKVVEKIVVEKVVEHSLSEKQRSILNAMLGDLKDLRSLIKS